VAEINPAQVRSTAVYLAGLVGCTVVGPLDLGGGSGWQSGYSVSHRAAGMCGHERPNLVVDEFAVYCYLLAGHDGWHRGSDESTWSGADPRDAEVTRLRKLVGSEDVGSNWASIDRFEAIRQAEQFFAEADSLRTDRALLWELLKRSVRESRAVSQEVMAEWGEESARQQAVIERQRQLLGPESFDPQWASFDRFAAIGAVRQLNLMLTAAVRERDRLRLEVASARSIADEKRSVAEQLRAEIDELEQRAFKAYAELLNPIRAVFGKSPVDASHYRELRDGITRLISSHSVEATRHEQAKIVREVAEKLTDSEMVRLRKENASVSVERDRLRQELDLAAERTSNPRMAEALRTLGEVLDTVKSLIATPVTAGPRRSCPCRSQCDYLDGEDRCSDTCNCAAGRRWVAGDPEPEIGVTVRRTSVADYYQSWTRMPNGSWHPNHACRHEHADQCSGLVFAEWKQLPRPLVEVVNTGG
jgi:hypothetical protein